MSEPEIRSPLVKACRCDTATGECQSDCHWGSVGPAMLTALELAVKLADEQMEKFYSGRTPESQEAYELCVAAIAMATGNSQ